MTLIRRAAGRRALLLPLTLAFLACGEDDPTDPDPCESANPPASCNEPEPDGYAFVYSPPAGAPAITSMSLRGVFNGWGETPMELDDGSWVAYVELDSTTTYAYKFFINGAWIPDMCSDDTWGHDASGGVVHLDSDGCVDDGQGGRNAIIVLGEIGLGFSHSPSDPVSVSIANDSFSIRFRARSDQVASAWLLAGDDRIPMHRQLATGYEEVWRVRVPTTLASYRIEVAPTSQTDPAAIFGPFEVPANPFRSVSWASDVVAYQIFPERFWNGDPSNDSLTLTTDEFVFNTLWQTNGPTLAASWDAAPNNQHCCHQYFGGDLAGIVQKLDHLVDLGVTAVYLNPIWDGGSAHGYDTHDYTRPAPEFGDSAMLRTFVDAAHAAGIRVIWDFVPNHVGLGFWAFQDAVQNGESSDYWDWFNFHPDGDGLQAGDADDYDGWWGFGSLPELQTENPEVMTHVLDVAASWTAYGFDGIRVDVPGDIDNRAAFFPAFRAATKAVNPDVYLIGEIWERNPTWLEGDEFDALMNYALGRDVVQRFANSAMSAGAAWSAMAELFATYPEAATAMLFNVIATHDTDRLLTQLGGGELGASPSMTAMSRQRLASALQYAIPGMPVTYYGDECAMLGSSQGSIHRGRRTMQWDSCDQAMLAHYRLLGRLKHEVAALGSGTVREYVATGTLLSFLRGEPGSGEVIAAFNQSGSSPQTLPLPAGTWTDAVSAESFTGSVDIPAYGWRYLVRQ